MNYLKFLICVLALASSPVFAEGPENTASDNSASSKPNGIYGSSDAEFVENNWYLFGGIDVGYSLLNSSVVGEENKGGLGGNLKLLASRYWPKWVFDGGIGIEYKNISGTRPTGFQGTLETRTFLLELDLRRRLTPHFELGVFLSVNMFADVSHRPTINPLLINEPEKNLIFLTGIQGLYVVKSGETPLRFGGRLTTDLTIPNRRLIEIQAVLHIGIPLFETAKADGPKPASLTVIESEQEYFEINLLRVFFETDSAKLTQKSVEVLGRLAYYFKTHRSSFTKMEVEGHTDKVGSYSYNMTLSQQRADSVAKILVDKGVPDAIVIPRGYGFTRPLIRDAASNDVQRNRRVAIRIYGAGEKSLFVTELKKLIQ